MKTKTWVFKAKNAGDVLIGMIESPSMMAAPSPLPPCREMDNLRHQMGIFACPSYMS